MRFSIIIITNNRIELLKQTLNSLDIQTFKDFEAIIVDDGSDYIVEDMISPLNFSFKILHHRNPEKSGWSKPRNKGIAKAQGEIMINVDSDMVLIPDYLKLYDEKYKEMGRNYAISGYSYYMNENAVPENYNINKFLNDIQNGKHSYSECEVRKWYNIIDQTDRWKCFIGNNSSCYLEDARSINGYNECFVNWGPDDIEFGYRLQKLLGRNIIMGKELLSYHLWHPKADEQKKMEFFIDNNKIFSQQHPEIKWAGILPIRHYIKFLEYSNVAISDHYKAMLKEIEGSR